MFGSERRLRFSDDPVDAVALAKAEGRSLLVWAGKAGPGLTASGLPLRRVEDGFLRSRGLGAQLIRPLSLVTDDLGIYYDPSHESRLERLIAAPVSAFSRRDVMTGPADTSSRACPTAIS